MNRYSVTLTELRYLREITEISYFENANFILLSLTHFVPKLNAFQENVTNVSEFWETLKEMTTLVKNGELSFQTKNLFERFIYYE